MYDEKKISAKIDTIFYPKDGNYAANTPTFYIIRAEVNGRKETVKGKMSNPPKQGERYLLEGKWEPSRYTGNMEFIFFHYAFDLPTDERSMLRLACDMTSGIGIATETNIWEALGENWRNVKLSDKIRGVNPSNIARLQAAIQQLDNQRERSTTIAWLMSVGCTPKMAAAAWDKWTNKTVIRVKEDPFILAELPNYGFKDCDEHIRDYFHITVDDPRRIRAAILYFVAQLTESNTVCLWVELYSKVSHALNNVSPAGIIAACSELFKDKSLVPFRASGTIARFKDEFNERLIVNFIRNEVSVSSAQTESFSGKIALPKPPFTFDESQLAAIHFAVDNNFAVINGGAGCGKTTIIKSIADTLANAGQSIELCAFAGKAAARLKEATGHEASTIHRMLRFMGEGVGFSRESLNGVSVILDEASMVASDLLAEIVKRNPKRLILVGDEAQLPPVGAGQPFHDIVRLFPQKVKTLTTCYRNKEAIFQAALKIRRGLAPSLHAQTEKELWNVEAIGDVRAIHARILSLVKSGGVDFDTDIILCCRNGESVDDPCSVMALNADIKEIVNPASEEEMKDATFSPLRPQPGDRIINTKNHADLDVWNGTTGKCDRFDNAGAMWVKLDFPNEKHEDTVLIPKKQIREWQLAYALTVHKSQGSQYRKVFFVCTRRDTAQLLDRPMIYTAVTRAKAECHVIGDMGALYKAVMAVEDKMTVIQELVKQI